MHYRNRFHVIVGCFVILFSEFVASSPSFANEATRTSVCLRINRVGALVNTTVYKEAAQIRTREALAAINRAAMPNFPPLPAGSPEFVDFHWDVVCGCTGYIYSDKMRLCNQAHKEEMQKQMPQLRQQPLPIQSEPQIQPVLLTKPEQIRVESQMQQVLKIREAAETRPEEQANQEMEPQVHR